MEYPDDVSESDTASSAADLEALRALQAEASELERIEELLERYGRSGAAYSSRFLWRIEKPIENPLCISGIIQVHVQVHPYESTHTRGTTIPSKSLGEGG
jgi:hypothetical protein